MMAMAMAMEMEQSNKCTRGRMTAATTTGLIDFHVCVSTARASFLFAAAVVVVIVLPLVSTDCKRKLIKQPQRERGENKRQRERESYGNQYQNQKIDLQPANSTPSSSLFAPFYASATAAYAHCIRVDPVHLREKLHNLFHNII